MNTLQAFRVLVMKVCNGHAELIQAGTHRASHSQQCPNPRNRTEGMIMSVKQPIHDAEHDSIESASVYLEGNSVGAESVTGNSPYAPAAVDFQHLTCHIAGEVGRKVCKRPSKIFLGGHSPEWSSSHVTFDK